jgi:hypothetical protein
LSSIGLRAQDLIVTLNNSTTETFAIATIQSIKFGDSTMILKEINGTVTTWDITDIDNYDFSSGVGLNDQVNPLKRYGFPATKIYRCYNGQTELVYDQPKPVNNGRKLPAFSSFKANMNSEPLSGYQYILYPESFTLETLLLGEIKILRGAKMGPRMGHGFISYYKMEEDRLIETDHFTHWLS